MLDNGYEIAALMIGAGALIYAITLARKENAKGRMFESLAGAANEIVALLKEYLPAQRFGGRIAPPPKLERGRCSERNCACTEFEASDADALVCRCGHLLTCHLRKPIEYTKRGTCQKLGCACLEFVLGGDRNKCAICGHPAEEHPWVK